jgi:hypothetical protein
VRLVSSSTCAPPQVAIQAKIVFVTAPSRGAGRHVRPQGLARQLADQLTPFPTRADPTGLTNANLVSLGGSSIARWATPTSA